MDSGELDGLRTRRVLVVEDEPLISMALSDELERLGAYVVGPASSVASASELIESAQVDAAILDIELQQELIFPVADMLITRRVPFILTTGHDLATLPARYAGVPTSSKPAATEEVVRTLARRMADGH